MADRLPPEVAALVPNGDQVVVGDLTLEQVRDVLARVAVALASRASCATSDHPVAPVEGAAVEGPQG